MINHVKGDIFKSNADIIIHQVNCQGVMGSGVAKQVKDLYPNVYVHYREYCKDFTPEEMLGTVFMVPIDNKTRFVANFFSQNNFGYDGNCYTNYEAFEKCLRHMRKYYSNLSMAIPYLIGCCRGGGSWEIIYKMIEDILGDCEVTIYEYDLG
jgi:O-acetyl-ADP-ribose deacetylase (regulator of RNase III)